MIETALLSSPHMHRQRTVKNIMSQVVLALVPGILVSAWLLGFGVLVHCLLAVIFALSFEAAMLFCRNRAGRNHLGDGSAIVTGLLFALAITPWAPWWLTLSGICFAMLVKHLYGGLGCNIFNPAMAGYAFVLLCFPVEVNYWSAVGNNPSLAESLTWIFAPPAPEIDGLSGATTLTFTKNQLQSMAMLSELADTPLMGLMGGKDWEWIGLVFMAGGLWLVFKGIISWQIPLTVIVTLSLLSLVFYGYDPDRYSSPLFNLFTGGTMLAAFFIATDPVTAATTPRGRIIYAAGIGSLIYIIRTWSNYPDGIAFAVLIMNAAVPFIDHYTRPGVFGEIKP